MPVIRTMDTETQSLPTLSIIAPTPRTFTFPIDHNLASNDSPASSRSSSPFEPELRPLALQCTTPLMRTLSPPISSSSSPTKRRKSTSTDAERRPKKGDQDYVKRPENAFILFRRKCCEDRQQALDEAGSDAPNKKQRQADLSKTISQQWKSLPSEERAHWESLAKEKKKEHEQLHPGYVYRPQRARDQEGKLIRKKSTSRGRRETDTDHLSFVVPMTPRNHGRSFSAPTPPPAPYQAIQIPNVYPMTPSCPTSPSLLTMISRRSAHPGHPEQVMSDFDYLPAGNFSYSHAGFEPHIQSSDSLRSLFSPSAELTPLDMSQPPMLLPAHQIVSPGSSHGSSGPPSPHLEPFTPTSDMLSHSFPHLAIDSSPCMQLPIPEHDLQMGLQYQLHQEFDHMGYNAYSWGGDPTPALWQQAGCELQLGGDDFDLSAIPPIELGIPKYDEYPQDDGYLQDHTYSQEPHCQNQYLDQGLLGYDHAHHF